MRAAPWRTRSVRLTPLGQGDWEFVNTHDWSDPGGLTVDALARSAHAHPDGIWLAERPPGGQGWQTTSYAQGWARVRRLAQGLLEAGLGRGQVLLILSGNSVDHACLTYAANMIGVAACPVTPAYATLAKDFSRLRYIADLVRPSAVFCAPLEPFARALDALELAPEVQVITPCGQSPFGRGVRLGDLEAAAPDVRLERALQAVEPNDPAKLLLTSGSTGDPKAVVNTHRNLVSNAAMIRATFDDQIEAEPQVMATFLPWSHSLGANAILHFFTSIGATLYLDPGSATPQLISETVRTLREVAPTYHNTVPVGWALLADQFERDAALAANFFSRVRILQYGGAALAQSVYERIQRVAIATIGERITFAAGYGATETAPTVTNVHWPNARMGLLGLPVPGVRLRLLERGDGQFEMRVKGPSITPGYLRDPVRTAAVFDPEGWFILGDLVRFADSADPSQGLVFDGRIAEAFKLESGGWVEAGRLRAGLVAEIGPVARDVIITGVNAPRAGALVFLAEGPARALVADGSASLADLCGHPAIRAAVAAALARWNARAPVPALRVMGAMILPDAPDLASGEVTDKGSLAQGRLREVRRAGGR